MIKVGILSPGINDATSLYRAGGPFSALRDDIHVTFMDKATNITVLSQDVIFMQRPFNEVHFRTAQMVKRCRVPLWVDYDDFLFDVPRDNPNYSLYMNEKVHMHLFQIAKMADIVTVSTKTLKALYEKEIDAGDGNKITLSDNVNLITNAYDKRFHGERILNTGNKLITWRGSKTHDKDLAHFAMPIVKFMNDHKDWKIEFLGYNPWQLTEQIEPSQVTITDPMEPFLYMEHFKSLQPSIHIVPLHDSIFNRAKSNIAWIEATIAGAVTICPDWDGWRNEGTFRYKDVEEFIQCLTLAASASVEDMNINLDHSFEVISLCFYLDNENELRKNIIYNLDDLDGGRYKIPTEDYADLFNQPKKEGVIDDAKSYTER